MIIRKRVSFAILALGAPLAMAAPVVGIQDGDTLTILENNRPIKIRLANIDAPEKKQPFGQRSRQSLSDLCFGKDAAYKVQTTDRYRRTVAVVYCDGIEANRAQVERGMAWVFTRYNKDKSLPLLESAAQSARRGLWADANPTPPWIWRKQPNPPHHPIN